MAKRRGRGEGTIFQRADGRWTGEVSLGYRAGQRTRKQVYGPTRAEVSRKLTAILSTQQRGLPVLGDRLTVGRFLEDWLNKIVSPRTRPSTFESYKGLVEQHLGPALGGIRLSRLAPADVQEFMTERLASGLSRRTVAYCRAVLRSALNQALRWDLVNRNVATLVDPPRVKRTNIEPFTVDELQVFLEAAEGSRFRALFVLAVSTGARRGEILGLRWSNIDLKAGLLTVAYALQRVKGRGLELVEPKSESSRRTLRLSQGALAALKEHRLQQLQARLAAGSQWQEAGFVFTTGKGTPLDHHGVITEFKRVLAKAGLRAQRFHDLRHAHASLLLAEGVHPRVVMEMMGHSQISLTLNTYSHVIPALQSDAVAKIDAALMRNQT